MQDRASLPWDEEVEVLVIGGGPGGSVTAARLAQRGRKALVLEQARFPRFHIGESLLPQSAPLLQDLGVADELDRVFLRKYSARFLDDGAGVDGENAIARYPFEDAYPPSIPYAWEVTRAEFDTILLRRAAALGAEVREGYRVERILQEGSRVTGAVVVTPEDDRRRIGAKITVDATGRDALLARSTARASAPSPRLRVPGLDMTAIFTHIEGGHRHPGRDEGQIEIIILAGNNSDGSTTGWAWFIPFRGNKTSVGFVLSSEVVRARIAEAGAIFGERQDPSPREYAERSREAMDRLDAVWDAELTRSPWMRELIGDAPRVGPVRAAADYSFRVETVAGDGWLAVGDSTGFIDPLFSTGAHLAMQGGDRAAAVIDDALAQGDVSAARFEGYAREMRAAADLFLGAVQSFYRGELRGLLFAREKRPALKRTITSMLAGDVFHPSPAPSWVGFFRERFPAQL